MTEIPRPRLEEDRFADDLQFIFAEFYEDDEGSKPELKREIIQAGRRLLQCLEELNKPEMDIADSVGEALFVMPLNAIQEIQDKLVNSMVDSLVSDSADMYIQKVTNSLHLGRLFYTARYWSIGHWYEQEVLESLSAITEESPKFQDFYIKARQEIYEEYPPDET